jgi:hypothetical protein
VAERERGYVSVAATDCAIAFGIPTSREQFISAVRARTSDLIYSLRGGWQEYRYAFLDAFEATAAPFHKVGITVIPNAALEHFAELFGTHRAIVLFSHWNRETVEFADGMRRVEDIVEQIPKEFTGVLDLCVCHPVTLVKTLRAERPECLVKFMHHTARPRYWLHLYKLVFEIIALRGRSNYLDALETAIQGLRGIDMSAHYESKNRS